MSNFWKRLWCLHYWDKLWRVDYLGGGDLYECGRCGKQKTFYYAPLNPPKEFL